jgi:hypothetical protein
MALDGGQIGECSWTECITARALQRLHDAAGALWIVGIRNCGPRYLVVRSPHEWTNSRAPSPTSGALFLVAVVINTAKAAPPFVVHTLFLRHRSASVPIDRSLFITHARANLSPSGDAPYLAVAGHDASQ